MGASGELNALEGFVLGVLGPPKDAPPTPLPFPEIFNELGSCSLRGEMRLSLDILRSELCEKLAVKFGFVRRGGGGGTSPPSGPLSGEKTPLNMLSSLLTPPKEGVAITGVELMDGVMSKFSLLFWASCGLCNLALVDGDEET